MEAVYKRVLLKISGEALAGNGTILCGETMQRVCEEIKKCSKLGVSFAIIIGAGNIWRGARQNGLTIDRVRADQMGMLATVINALAFSDYLINAGIDARVMSAFTIQQVCEPYSQYRAIDYLNEGKAVLIPCGVGYPFFSTDTGMVLRAAELKCDVVLAAKNVDGVYDSDPAKNPNAKKYDTLTYAKALSDNLGAIDATASALADSANIKTLLFSLHDTANITKAVCGESIGTLMTK